MTINHLEQLRHLKKEIKMLEKRIANHEDSPEVFVSDSVVGSLPCVPYQPYTITIKGYGNRYQDKINALQVKYIVRKQQLCKELEDIEVFIESLKDSWLRQIIEYRYVKGMAWNEVAKNVYGYPNGDAARKAVKRFFEKS